VIITKKTLKKRKVIPHKKVPPTKNDIVDKIFLNINNSKAPSGDMVKDKEILDSWKAISNYLDRDIKTCARWEKNLGLPVHRIDTDSSRSKVFAYKLEIDQWWEERANNKGVNRIPSQAKKKAIILLTSLAAILIILAALYFTILKPVSPSSENLSLAVLPLENQDGSEYDAYFTEGITNEIINSMARLSTIKVIPAKSPSNHSDTPGDIRHIRNDLGADYVLKGKVAKNENKIGIYIQLIKAKNEENVWEAKFEGKLEDIFRIQENISEKINEILSVRTGEKVSLVSNHGKTDDYLAFETYMKGSYILNRLNGSDDDPWKLYHQGHYYWGKCTPEFNEIAINLFNQAIKIDKNFAQAYIGLAHCYANYINFFWDYNKTWLDKAEDLIKKAQEISPDLPEYYSILAEIYLLKDACFSEDTKSMAFGLAEEGMNKYPNHAQLNSISGYCYYLKFGEKGNEADFEMALEHKERSFWLNPYALGNIVYAEFLMLNRDFYKAVEVCNVIEKHDPSQIASFQLGEIYYYLGDLDRSKTIFRQFENASLGLKFDSLYHLAMIAAQSGEKEEALGLIEEIKRMSPEKYILDGSLMIASIYMGLGLIDLGYDYLSSFFNRPEIRKNRYIYLKYVDIDKNFDTFREEEEFQKIIKGEING